jgi:hypothetical protein
MRRGKRLRELLAEEDLTQTTPPPSHREGRWDVGSGSGAWDFPHPPTLD